MDYTSNDYELLDNATANEALAIIMNEVLTDDQKKIIITDGNGHVTLEKFIEYAIENINRQS